MIGDIVEISKFKDERGILTTVNNIPFDAKRIFFITDVPKGAIRGNHFSKTSEFLYIVVSGGCRVELGNGLIKELYELGSGEGLLFPKNVWMTLSNFRDGTVLCVLADKEYNSYDYSSDYNAFLKIVREKNV